MRLTLRLLALVLISVVALEIGFALRIASMRFVDPQSTAFQRSEVWRALAQAHRLHFEHDWVASKRISPRLARAVIASEDAGFADHHGIEWGAIKGAWQKNQRSQATAQRRASAAMTRPGAAAPATAKVVGGSTISQQLAKNLFLSGERTVLRKAQELLITLMLETLLDKRRILEIYLNSVEWGEGVFGAQAAARRYFHVDASQLDDFSAARLAVMLPAPKRFEKNPASAYVAGRAATIVARMDSVALP
jgi:monofunctional biosynthetic peptidoglycan transglycosylase